MFHFHPERRVSERIGEPFVNPQNAIFGVLEKDHRRCQIKEHPEFGLLLLQHLVDLFALSYVAGYTRQANQFARRISNLKATVINPTNGAIRSRYPVFHAHFRRVFH